MLTSSINVETLHYFLELVNTGSFSRAALSLGIQASTVSRAITRLEDELGLTIVERSCSGVRLTAGGRAVLIHVRRVMADINGIELSAHCNATGNAGYIRLGIRMPPIGKPLQPLLATWRTRFPDVELTLHEMNEHDILMATEERRLDVALVTKHTLWPHAIAEPIYREPICLALSKDHPLVPCKTVKWDNLRGETFLVQGWDESQTAREFYATFLGSGARYQSHAASKQSIMALVGAGFGVTLVTESQAEVRFPGVVYKKIDERNAQIEVDLVWVPENKEAVVGRFVAFMRDEARSRHLI